MKPPRRRLHRSSGLLQHPDFLKLWAGQSISLLGSQVTLLALPLTAIAYLGASPVQIGLLTAVGTLPSLLLGLPVGVWADRLPRRPLLILSDAGRTLVLLSIPIGAALGRLSVGYLFAIAFLAGSLDLVFDVASAAFLPGLVGRAHLVEASGKLSLSSSLAQIAGPGLAGTLVQLFTAPFAIVVDAASYLASALSIVAIRGAEPPATGNGDGSSFWSDLGTGLTAIRANPLLRSLILASGWLFFWNSVMEAVWLLYLIRGLGLTPALVGVIFAVGNVGLLLGSATVTWVTGRLGIGRTLVLAVVGVGVADVVTPVVGMMSSLNADPGKVALALFAAQVVFGWAVVTFTTTSSAVRQASIPDHLRGRMSAATRVLLNGVVPLGALLGGILGLQIGLQATLLVTVAGELSSTVILLTTPIARSRDVPPVTT